MKLLLLSVLLRLVGILPYDQGGSFLCYWFACKGAVEVAYAQEYRYPTQGYLPRGRNTEEVLRGAEETGRISSLSRLSDRYPGQVSSEAMLMALQDSQPIVIGLLCPQDGLPVRLEMGDYGEYSYFEHAVVVVGYKDGYFRILNSWGKGWGEGGYGWVEAEVIENYLLEAWVFRVPELTSSDCGVYESKLRISAEIPDPFVKQRR
jgi:hypothetical protein